VILLSVPLPDEEAHVAQHSRGNPLPVRVCRLLTGVISIFAVTEEEARSRVGVCDANRPSPAVEREGQKLIKLIEFTTPRPIPIVSFVARQRDLREFVGDEMPGADKLSFADALKHWNDRFHRISLADRNLPKIAERRLLKPKGEAERLQIDAAFANTERTNPQTLDILMTEEGDRELFRSIYPFSPAFMVTLVAASSALQRERTALRVMLQLLVDRRDELTVGDLVSVGDLFDVLAGGDEPFSDDMKRHFDGYPHNYGLHRPDPNIDHRRVPNQIAFLRSHGRELPILTTGPATAARAHRSGACPPRPGPRGRVYSPAAVHTRDFR